MIKSHDAAVNELGISCIYTWREPINKRFGYTALPVLIFWREIEP